jgi:flavin-dependent dehydrogenase
VERERFDAILLERAAALGVRVCAPVAALAAELDPGDGPQRVRCRTAAGEELEIACRLVIDASGQKTWLARQLGVREIDAQFRFFSVWGYYQGSRYVGADGRAHPHGEVFTNLPTTFVTSLPRLGDWGWSWHIPLRESTSVGLVLPLTALADQRDSGLDWDAWLDRECRATPVLGDLLAGARLLPGSVASIRDYSYQTRRPAGPGYFLAGDAAGFVDPIFSVGIVFSFYSAYAAAWAAHRCLAQPAQAPRYQAIYAEQLGRRVAAVRALALPSYAGGTPDPRALHGVGFESLNEQALMNVVATMTTRSGNFHALGLGGPAVEAAAARITELERIHV